MLQLEIPRSHKENERLSRKLELNQAIVGRGDRGISGPVEKEDSGEQVDFTAGEFRGSKTYITGGGSSVCATC